MSNTKLEIRSFTQNDYYGFAGVEGDDPKIVEINEDHVEFENIAWFIQSQLDSRNKLDIGYKITDLTIISDKTGIYFQAFVDMGALEGRTFYDVYENENEEENKLLLENIILLAKHKPLIIMKMVGLGLFDFSEA